MSVWQWKEVQEVLRGQQIGAFRVGPATCRLSSFGIYGQSVPVE